MMAKGKQKPTKGHHGAAKPAKSRATASSSKRPVVKKASSTNKRAQPVAKKGSAAHGVKTTGKAAAKPAIKAASKPAVAAKSRAKPAPAAKNHPKPVAVRPKADKAHRQRSVEQPNSTITVQDGHYALPAGVEIELPSTYKPKASEGYMVPRHLAYFRNKLRRWRDDLVEESRQTIESLRDEVRDVGDDAERATRETENSLELRTRDRYRKLIAKIDNALKRIEEGRYGYCEETDEEIGLERLEARPIATLSLDAQERREHRQRQMGD